MQQLITRNSHAIVPHFPISTVGPCFQHRSIRTEVQGAGRRACWRAFYLCCVRLNGVMCVRMLEPLVKYSDGLVHEQAVNAASVWYLKILPGCLRGNTSRRHTEAIIRKPFSCLRRTLMKCISTKRTTACHIRADVPWRQIVLLPLVSMLRTKTDRVTTRRLPQKQSPHRDKSLQLWQHTFQKGRSVLRHQTHRN